MWYTFLRCCEKCAFKNAAIFSIHLVQLFLNASKCLCQGVLTADLQKHDIGFSSLQLELFPLSTWDSARFSGRPIKATSVGSSPLYWCLCGYGQIPSCLPGYQHLSHLALVAHTLKHIRGQPLKESQVIQNKTLRPQLLSTDFTERNSLLPLIPPQGWHPKSQYSCPTTLAKPTWRLLKHPAQSR